jgi:hypothetical protein
MKTSLLIVIVLASIYMGLLIGRQIYSFRPIKMTFSTDPAFSINRCLTAEQIKEMSKFKSVSFTVFPSGRIKIDSN